MTRIARYFYEKSDKQENYLSVDLVNTIRDLAQSIFRGLTFDKNFLSATIEITIAASTSASIDNVLRDRRGVLLEPSGFLVLRDSGHRDVAMGDTWSETTLSFKNYHPTLSGTWTLILLKSDANQVREQ